VSSATRTWHLRLAVVALVAAGLAGCARRWLPTATDADAERVARSWPGTTATDLNRGRTLLMGHCGNCHQPPSPREHDAAAWPPHVAEMRERSGLTTGDASLVERYLVAFARDVVPPR